MKYLTIICVGLALTAITVSSCNEKESNLTLDYTQLVNPFIGTDFTGNTYPGAQVPFGMVQLSPDNGLPGWDRIAGYFYPDSTIAGFSHTHLSGTGAGDLYDILFMPVTLPYNEAEQPLGIHSKFSHEKESAYAGYYQVFLQDYKINVELTATERCGIQRYKFPKAESAIFLNLKKAMNWDETQDSYIEQVDSVTLKGYRYSNGWARNQKIYFYTKFSRPFDSLQLDKSPIIKDGKENGHGYIARINYNTSENEQIVIRTAISGVSMEGAERNFMAEAQESDFDSYLCKAKKMWNDALGKIEVENSDMDETVTFYTALYHSMLAPTIYGDVDGSYYGPDKKIHKADGWTNYSTFSLWDTYRAAHPLFTIIQPERVNDMVKSLIAFSEQNGRLPVWNMFGSETDMMIGYHSVPVIVDAYLKGIGDFDAESALKECVKTANLDDYRQIGLYKNMGYIPYDVVDKYNIENWSLSKTLEYAFDDYCIALMAEKMGKEDLADNFYKRASNYRNVFNKSSSFMQPKDSKGNFIAGFKPEEYTPHITESNGWQYLWSVQHDVDGLIDEPSHHVAYLYNYTDSPWKTQKYVSEIMHELYKNSPDGLCGNEDCGQMSAWYVMSAMGIYPVNPVSGEYQIGTPMFPEMQIRFAENKVFKILAKNVSRENCYVKSVKLNGVALEKPFINHKDIMKGGVIEFTMTDKPTKWGVIAEK